VKEAATGLANSGLSLGHAWTTTKPISKQRTTRPEKYREPWRFGLKSATLNRFGSAANTANSPATAVKHPHRTSWRPGAATTANHFKRKPSLIQFLAQFRIELVPVDRLRLALKV
jgi:hypothetical protein